MFPRGEGEDGKALLLSREGDVLEMNSRSTLRDKDFRGQGADEFCPERRCYLMLTREHTLFGGGPRICPGS